MKPSPSCFLLGISRRSLLYRIYSIGDNGDPWGMPVGVGMWLVVIPLNRICVILLLRKDSIHCVISAGILCLRILCMSRSWCMLLKAPATSMNIAAKTFPFFQAR